MENLKRTAAKIETAIRERHGVGSQAFAREYELEDFQDIYRLTESLVDDFDRIVGTLPPDLIHLRNESQRILRRFRITHPTDEDTFRSDLIWMNYYGDTVDQKVICAVRPRAEILYPASIGRLDAAVQSIQGRSLETKMAHLLPAVTAKPPVWRPYLIFIGIIFPGIIVGHYISGRGLALLLGFVGGSGSAAFLLFEGIRKTRNVVSRICFITASVLMMLETMILFEIGH